jgi:hypothetical protein
MTWLSPFVVRAASLLRSSFERRTSEVEANVERRLARKVA